MPTSFKFVGIFTLELSCFRRVHSEAEIEELVNLFRAQELSKHLDDVTAEGYVLLAVDRKCVYVPDMISPCPSA